MSERSLVIHLAGNTVRTGVMPDLNGPLTEFGKVLVRTDGHFDEDMFAKCHVIAIDMSIPTIEDGYALRRAEEGGRIAILFYNAGASHPPGGVTVPSSVLQSRNTAVVVLEESGQKGAEAIIPQARLTHIMEVARLVHLAPMKEIPPEWSQQIRNLGCLHQAQPRHLVDPWTYVVRRWLDNVPTTWGAIGYAHSNPIGLCRYDAEAQLDNIPDDAIIRPIPGKGRTGVYGIVVGPDLRQLKD